MHPSPLSIARTPRFGAVELQRATRLGDTPGLTEYRVDLTLTGQDYYSNLDLLVNSFGFSKNDLTLTVQLNEDSAGLYLTNGNKTEGFNLKTPLPEKAQRALALLKKTVMSVKLFEQDDTGHSAVEQVMEKQSLLKRFVQTVERIQGKVTDKLTSPQEGEH